MKGVLIVVVLAAMAHTGSGAMARALLKAGESYSYDFGPNNSVIKRQWGDDKSSSPQFIYADTDYWTNEKKDAKFDEGNVHFYSNGTLVIDKVKEKDFASYTLPDEPPKKVGENQFVGNSMIVFERDNSQ